jgi:hypothetical protein
MTFTTDPGAKIGAVAAALVTALGGIDDVTLLDYDPGISGVQDTLTGGVGEVTGRSTEPLQRGRTLSYRDWPQQWAVRIYVHLDDPSVAWASARKAMGQALNSLDSDFTLGGEVQEAAVTSYSITPSDRFDSPARRLLIVELTVSVFTRMSDPSN